MGKILKKAIYTCITGDYDKLITPLYVTPGWDYVCFTDNKHLESDFWDIRILNTEYTSTRKARHVKIMVSEFMPEYDITIWVDGNIQPNCNADEFVDNYLCENSDLGVSMHPDRNCVYQEIAACMKMRKDDILTLRQYDELLKSLDYPPFNGLVQSNVIIRRNTKDIHDFSKAWWKQVLKFSKRDQLSFNYIMHKLPINYNLFSTDILLEHFLLYKHLGNNPAKLRKGYGSNFYYFNALSDDKTIFVKKNSKVPDDVEDVSDINKFLYKNGLNGFNDFKIKIKGN